MIHLRNGVKSKMSRLTFRDAAGDVAWQKQLRDSYASEGLSPSLDLSVKRAVVRPVSRKLAEQIILKYEWLGTMAPTMNRYFGIFFSNYCAGVCCFGIGSAGAGVNVHLEWCLERDELAYLGRGANVHWSPIGANSKLVSWSCKLLKNSNPKVKLVLAYSDTDAGEIGTIYQACNWVCVGRGSSTHQWVAPNGRIYDQKLPSNLRNRDKKRFPRSRYVAELKQAGWYEQASNPKYRYVYVLDKRDNDLIRLVESKRVPYPKRDDMRPVNGDNLATSQAGRFDPDLDAFNQS